MKTGQLDGILMGGEYQKVYDSGEIGSAVTSLTISGLDGNNEVEYRLIGRMISGSSSNTWADLLFNNDTTMTNYGYQYIFGTSTTVAAGRATGDSAIFESDATSEISMCDVTIYAKSGFIRPFINKEIRAATGLSVLAMDLKGMVWSNTTDNVTSLVIRGHAANLIGVGSRIILLRRNAQAVGSRTGTLNVQGQCLGTFQKVYSTTLAAASTSVSISGLTGNTAVFYLLKARVVSNAAGNSIFIRPNNDAAQANYGYQYIEGNGTNAYALSQSNNATYTVGMRCSSDEIASGNIEMIDATIYAKSGYTRSAIISAGVWTGTTVIEDTSLMGAMWSNTADEITSMVLASNQANGLGIGTVIELYAYRVQ